MFSRRQMSGFVMTIRSPLMKTFQTYLCEIEKDGEEHPMTLPPSYYIRQIYSKFTPYDHARKYLHICSMYCIMNQQFHFLVFRLKRQIQLVKSK